MLDGENEFVIKRIWFHDMETCMLMQNQNGPCPLLALANVLFLRGALTPPHPDLPKIHISELTAMLAEYMLDVNKPSEVDDEMRANLRQNLQDGMSLFPKLQRGLDVNVKFHAVDAFEYSEDLLLFDLLHVRLLHGWLVDPQDSETCAAVGNLTYNQVVERIIEFQSLVNEGGQEDPQAVPQKQVNGVQRVGGGSGGAPNAPSNDDELKRALALSMDEVPSGQRERHDGLSTRASTDSVDDAQTPSDAAGEHDEPVPSPVFDPFPSVQQNAPTVASSREDEAKPDPNPAPAPNARSTEAIVRDGLLLQEWLQRSASQLSYYGLERLHTDVSDRELCVFFRNNHFATITKHEGELYLLMTDLGYAREPLIVWERLNQIDGDSTLCTSYFQRVDESETATATEAASVAAFEAQFAEAEAARAAEAAFNASREGRGNLPADGASLTAGGYAVPDRVDPDLALALQLQREEEAMVRQAEAHAHELQQQQQLARQHAQPLPRGYPQATMVERQRQQYYGSQGQSRPRPQPPQRSGTNGGGCMIQ